MPSYRNRINARRNRARRIMERIRAVRADLDRILAAVHRVERQIAEAEYYGPPRSNQIPVLEGHRSRQQQRADELTEQLVRLNQQHHQTLHTSYHMTRRYRYN